MRLDARNLRPCVLLVFAAVFWVAGAAAGQSASGPPAEPSQGPLACGFVAGDAARAGYFAELCRAAMLGVAGDTAPRAPVELPAHGAVAALAEGEVAVAFGVPFELRAQERAEGVGVGPVVLIGPDGRWALAYAPGAHEVAERVAWIFHALVQAEAYGVDAAQLARGLEGADRERLHAYEARLAEQLGLPGDFLRRVLAAFGHHGEIFDRHFPSTGSAGVDRDANRPVELGGQLYAPPVSER